MFGGIDANNHLNDIHIFNTCKLYLLIFSHFAQTIDMLTNRSLTEIYIFYLLIVNSTAYLSLVIYLSDEDGTVQLIIVKVCTYLVAVGDLVIIMMRHTIEMSTCSIQVIFNITGYRSKNKIRHWSFFLFVFTCSSFHMEPYCYIWQSTISSQQPCLFISTRQDDCGWW